MEKYDFSQVSPLGAASALLNSGAPRHTCPTVDELGEMVEPFVKGEAASEGVVEAAECSRCRDILVVLHSEQFLVFHRGGS